jgi:rRNA maturation RNase YbeY
MIVSKNARKVVLSDSDREAVSNRQRSVRVPLRPLQTFLREVREELGLTEASVTIGLVSDAEIARMNERFRNKKGATDVLSFPAVARRGPRRSGLAKRRRSAFAEIEERLASSSVSSLDKWLAVTRAEERIASSARLGQASGEPYRIRSGEYLGDIAISPATARRYAKKNGRTFSNELRVLILHGVLHLLGYDHETDRGEMERVERKLRKRFGLA